MRMLAKKKEGIKKITQQTKLKKQHYEYPQENRKAPKGTSRLELTIRCFFFFVFINFQDVF